MSGEFDTSLTGELIQSSLAAYICEAENHIIAHESHLAERNVSERLALTILDSNIIGYPLGDELIPLSYIHDPSLKPQQNEQETTHDVLLDDINAFLHDRLLNPTLKFQSHNELSTSNKPLNQHYESFIRYSDFAGGIFADQEKVGKAEELLYTVDEHGIRTPTQLYQTYLGLLDEVFELELQAEELEFQGKNTSAERVRLKLDRKKGDLKVIGQQKLVEAARKVINLEDEAAGFEPQRERFLTKFEAFERHRLSSGLSYYSTSIFPLDPIFNPTISVQWQDVTLDRDDIASILSKQKAILELADMDIDSFCKTQPELKFEYVICELVHEWIDPEFFEADYWNNTKQLSDGNGKGDIPTTPKKIVFVRNVRCSFSTGFELLPKIMSGNPKTHKVPQKINLAQAGKTKLLNANLGKSNIRLAPQLEVYKHLSTNASPAIKLDQNRLLRKQAIGTAIQQQKLVTKRLSPLSIQSQMLKATAQPINTSRRAMVAQTPMARVGRTAKAKLPESIPKAAPQLAKGVSPQIIKAPLGIQKLARLKPWGRRPKPIHKKQKPKVISLEGSIETNENVSLEDVELVISQAFHSEVQRRTIQLKKQSNKKFNFAEKVFSNGTLDGNPNNLTHSDKVLIEFLYGEEVVFSNEVRFDKNSQTKKLDLVMSAQTSLLELANKTPTIFGYSLKLVPKSPRPSDAYDWSNDLFS